MRKRRVSVTFVHLKRRAWRQFVGIQRPKPSQAAAAAARRRPGDAAAAGAASVGAGAAASAPSPCDLAHLADLAWFSSPVFSGFAWRRR